MFGTGLFRRTAAAALVTGLAAASANAVTLTFNLEGNGRENIENADEFTARGLVLRYGTAWEQTQSTPDGDLTLRITPSAYTMGASGVSSTATIGARTFDGITLDNNARDSTASVTQSATGLGVMNNGTAATDDSPYDVDGSSGGIFGTGWFDYLVLEFDREVTLDYATFQNFGDTDRFRLMFDLDGQGVFGGEGDFLSDALGEGLGTGGVGQYIPDGGLTVSRFGLAAVSAGSAWRLEELGVSFPGAPTDPDTDPGTDPDPDSPGPPTTSVPDTPVPPIAPIPLPAAGWMLIAALGSLGALRRVTSQR